MNKFDKKYMALFFFQSNISDSEDSPETTLLYSARKGREKYRAVKTITKAVRQYAGAPTPVPLDTNVVDLMKALKIRNVAVATNLHNYISWKCKRKLMKVNIKSIDISPPPIPLFQMNLKDLIYKILKTFLFYYRLMCAMLTVGLEL